MIKKILLATDLADKSDRAMERALRIAHEQNARLYIVHIAPAYKGPRGKKGALDLQEYTQNLIQSYLDAYKDSEIIKAEIIIRQGGEVLFQILEIAYAHTVDLIIMGLHGKTKFRELFTGTTIERIVSRGMVPVLMVKNKPTGPYKKIISAIDFAPASRNAMRVALDMSAQANCVAMNVYNMPAYYADAVVYIRTEEAIKENNKKSMDAFIKTERSHYAQTHHGKERRLSSALLEGPLYDTLRKAAVKAKADLITVGAHGQFGAAAKLGVTTGDILSNPPCDVLVAPEKLPL